MINETCINCGIIFGVPDVWQSQRRNDHRTFYCPNGHQQMYSAETAEENIRRERDLLKQQIAQRDDEIKRRDKQIAEAKAEITKAKKRAKVGLCPCCNRSVRQLALHMKTEHPDFDPTVIDFATKRKAANK